MYLLRAWNKEEKASEMVIGWEARLEALKNENSQLKAQHQVAAAKASLLTGLQSDIDRYKHDYETLAVQHREADETWSNKISAIEGQSREATAALEGQLSKLRNEFASLANEREALTGKLDEAARRSTALENDLREAQEKLAESSTRSANLEAQANETRIRLSAVTSEYDRLRETSREQTTAQQENQRLQERLAATQRELAALRADMGSAEAVQNEWRDKWHESEAKQARAQSEIEALQARLQNASNSDHEKSKWQSEAATLANRMAQFEAQANETQSHISSLTREKESLLEQLQAAAQRAPARLENQDELVERVARAEQEAANLKTTYPLQVSCKTNGVPSGAKLKPNAQPRRSSLRTRLTGLRQPP
ncbi:MAG: hypothetical protein FJ145_14180 [Deltaproteobacteria bacterium]|nr:hypothetical protein [Deltaproteobacteria bacterium]